MLIGCCKNNHRYQVRMGTLHTDWFDDLKSRWHWQLQHNRNRGTTWSAILADKSPISYKEWLYELRGSEICSVGLGKSWQGSWKRIKVVILVRSQRVCQLELVPSWHESWLADLATKSIIIDDYFNRYPDRSFTFVWRKFWWQEHQLSQVIHSWYPTVRSYMMGKVHPVTSGPIRR